MWVENQQNLTVTDIGRLFPSLDLVCRGNSSSSVLRTESSSVTKEVDQFSLLHYYNTDTACHSEKFLFKEIKTEKKKKVHCKLIYIFFY